MSISILFGDENKRVTNKYQSKIANAIVNGIEKTFAG